MMTHRLNEIWRIPFASLDLQKSVCSVEEAWKGLHVFRKDCRNMKVACLNTWSGEIFLVIVFSNIKFLGVPLPIKPMEKSLEEFQRNGGLVSHPPVVRIGRRFFRRAE
jgi:hypothetical protein